MRRKRAEVKRQAKKTVVICEVMWFCTDQCKWKKGGNEAMGCVRNANEYW